MTSCCLDINICALLTVSVTFLVVSVFGQLNTETRARMIEPPMRSSYWRYGVSREGIDAPVNVKDELLNCGGFEYQWNQQNGACGACGDRIDPLVAVRENEHPGKYSQFLPVKKYNASRSNDELNVINVTILIITPNRLGYFVFRLCPYKDGSLPYSNLSQCFSSNNPLVVQDVNSTKYYPGSRGGYHDLHLIIPPNVSCEHCILQWTWLTGYREGRRNSQCEPCLGCGPQEQFVNCADIQISPVQRVTDPTGNAATTTSQPQTSTIQSTTTRPTPPSRTTSTRRPSTNGNVTPSPGNNVTACTPSADIVACEARDIQRLILGMDSWCLENCRSGHCMPDFCDCYCKYPGYKISIHPSAFDLKAPSKNWPPSSSTSSNSAKYLCYKPISLWSRTPGMSGWCANNCPSEWCADMCSLQVCP